MGTNFFVSATSEGGVKFRQFRSADGMVDPATLFSKPYFINAGSKTVKTYKEHPFK